MVKVASVTSPVSILFFNSITFVFNPAYVVSIVAKPLVIDAVCPLIISFFLFVSAKPVKPFNGYGDLKITPLSCSPVLPLNGPVNNSVKSVSNSVIRLFFLLRYDS